MKIACTLLEPTMDTHGMMYSVISVTTLLALKVKYISFKILEHEGTCCRDMLQGHVTATCSSDKTACYTHLGPCSRDMLRGNVAGTKSQQSHTQENASGTCFRDMLQEHVLTCELTLRGKLSPEQTASTSIGFC